MTDEPVGSPTQGTTADEPQNTVAPSTPGANATQTSDSDFQVPEKFANATKEDILRHYVELEKEKGRLSNEIGETRQRLTQYDEFYRSEYVQDPTDPTKVIHRSQLPTQQAAGPMGVQDEDVIREQLRDLQDEDPLKFAALMKDWAKKELQQEFHQRDSVYSDPSVQKIISDNPDVKARAEQLSMETGMSLSDALDKAFGEKMRTGMAGGQAANNQPPFHPNPSVNLNPLNTFNRTFMPASGRTPEPATESNLTDAQKAQIQRVYGRPGKPVTDFSRWEPFGSKNEERR